MILGIGLIMLATVFAVAGNWVRQSADESTGQMIGPTAAAAIQARYSAADMGAVTEAVTILPNLGTKMTWRMRTYAFGQPSPWPTPWRLSTEYNDGSPVRSIPPAFCWTALVRKQPGQVPGISYRYDIFVFVCKKGDAVQTFGTASSAARAATDPKDAAGNYYLPVPVSDTFGNMPVGVRGVAQSSGAVFRKLSTTDATVPMNSSDGVWYVPAADGTDSRLSPTVYVYTTTVSF
jgi:hypothetical protein